MTEQIKIDSNTQKVWLKMFNVGVFKFNLDADEMVIDGFCDGLFFRGKCYNTEIVSRVQKFNSLDGRFKISEGDFILDGFEDNFGEKKMRVILKKCGEILPNPKKEKVVK